MRAAALLSLLLLLTAFAAPIPRAASAAEPVDVAASHRYGCALYDDGSVWCWGGNFKHEPDPPWRARRVEPLPPATSIAVGRVGACAVDAAGLVRCWGVDLQRSVAENRFEFTAAPVLISGLPPVQHAAAGLSHACALSTAGDISCWGGNRFGQLGCGDRDGRSDPVKVELPYDVEAISAGIDNTCAILTNGQAACWGSDSAEVDGKFIYETLEPVLLDPAKVGPLRSVSNGRNFACGLRRDGEVTCWGSNIVGQIGSAQPRESVGLGYIGEVEGIRGAEDLDADHFYACAVAAGGEVRCWGAVTHSRSAAPRLASKASRSVPGLPRATRVAAGSNFACAIAEGDVLCWGDPQAIEGMDLRRPVPVPGLPR